MKQAILGVKMMLLLMGVFLSNFFFAQTVSNAGRSFHHVFMQNRTLTSTGEPTNSNQGDVVNTFYITNTSSSAPTEIELNFNGTSINYMVDGVLVTAISNVITETINAGSTISIVPVVDPMDPRETQVIDNGVVQNKMFTISVDAGNPEVTVFAESSQFKSRDGSLVLPDDALGSEYYTFSYAPDPLDNGTESVANDNFGGPSEVAVVALEETVVHFENLPGNLSTNLTDNDVLVTSGNFDVHLMAGEAIQLQSDNFDLSGVRVFSDNNARIAVYSGNFAVPVNYSSSSPGTWDHIVEQMFPKTLLGCQYVVAPLGMTGATDARNYVVRIIGMRDGTTINVGSCTINLDEGEVVEINPSTTIAIKGTPTLTNPISTQKDAGIYIDADQNVGVAQYGVSSYDYSGNNTDAIMTLIMPVDQSLTSATLAIFPQHSNQTDGNKKDFITIVSSGMGTPSLDVSGGASQVVGWTGVTGFGKFAIYELSNNSNDPIYSTIYNNSLASTYEFSAYVSGFDNQEGYGYTAGFNITPRGAIPSAIYCAAGTLTTGFDQLAFGSSNGNYTWSLVSGPAGSSFTNPNDAAPGFTASAPGEYFLQVVIPGSGANSCEITENVKVVFETEAPQVVLDDDYCGLYPTTAEQLFAEGAASYNWTIVSETGGTGSFNDATSATPGFYASGYGTYVISVEMISEGGCAYAQELTINLNECFGGCYYSLTDEFVKITEDITINELTYWDNKYYIDDGVIVTVDNAILDITNVDVVFGECAGIDFIKGGSLRANNSVFRPCEIDGTWRGLKFVRPGNFDNIVNECTFKNAIIALDFFQADGVMSGNLFNNNNIAIHVNNNGLSAPFNHPISGNQFVIDDFYPDFEACELGIPQNVIRGFYGRNLRGSILSLNNLIDGRTNRTATGFYGFEFDNAQPQVSENEFTNIHRAITVAHAAGPYEIVGNTIQINHILPDEEYGIYLFESQAVGLVAGNEIINTLLNTEVQSTSAGIYSKASYSQYIEDNYISGFQRGIWVVNYNGSGTNFISGNTIEKSLDFGINIAGSAYNNHSAKISCNNIKLDNIVDSKGISGWNISPSTEIYSNCLYDTYTAIYVKNTKNLSVTREIPKIRNNYLYNYSKYGFHNQNYTGGNIGTSTDHGMNTFWSNNSGATDVSSTQNINIANNFGVTNITSSTVSITQNYQSHSTASCAQQIYGVNSQGNLDPDLICNHYAKSTQGAMKVQNGTISFEDDFTSHINKMTDNKLSFLEGVMSSAGVIENPFYIKSVIREEVELTENEWNLLDFRFNSSLGNYSEAVLNLNDYESNNDAWKQLEILKLKKAQYGFNSNDIDVLKSYLNEENTFVFNKALGLLNQDRFEGNYLLDKKQNLEITSLFSSNIEENAMEVLPNPVTAEMTIELVNLDEIDGPIYISDITGRDVLTININFVAGRAKLDVSELQSGMYVVWMKNKSNKLSTRFVKQ